MSSSSNLIASVMLNAFAAMIKVFLIMLIGALGALYPTGNPLIKQSLLKDLSRLSNAIFTPAFMFASLGSGLSLKSISEIGIMIPISFIVFIVSYGVTYGVGGLLLTDRKSPIFRVLLIASSFPNSTSMPILILQSACGQSLINSDYNNDASVCFNAAMPMLFVYVAGWSLVFWSYGYVELEKSCELAQLELQSKTKDVAVIFETIISPVHPGDIECHPRVMNPPESVAVLERLSPPIVPPVVPKSDVEIVLQSLKSAMLSPPMIAICLGILVGICAPLQTLLFGSQLTVLKPLGDCIITLGQPLVCVNCLIMAASLVQVDFDYSSTGAYRLYLYVKQCVMSNTVSALTLTPESQSSTTVQYGEVRSPMNLNGYNELELVPPAVTPSDAITPPSILTSEKVPIPSIRYFYVQTLGRLIIPPIIILPILVILVESGLILRSQRLLQLVIVIQSCVPSAQMIILILNLFSAVDMAAKISILYVFHYILCIFTITFWFSIGMLYIYK